MQSATIFARLGKLTIAQRLRSWGPYVLMELLLPGGTLIALLLWLTQNGGAFRIAPTAAPVSGYSVALIAPTPISALARLSLAS